LTALHVRWNADIGEFSTQGEPVNSQDTVYVPVGAATCATTFNAN
jgi:hypothetical protein